MSLLEIQKQADLLNEEERAGLAAHLLASLSTVFTGADDDEVARRELEMDSGAVQPLSHTEFLRQVGRA